VSFFYISPDEIDLIAEKLKAVQDLIPDLQDRLEGLEDTVQDGDVMPQDGDCDGKAAQFLNTWRDEIGALVDMCKGYDEALTSTAEACRQADEAIAQAFAEALAAQMPRDGSSVAV
jgi:uncharacterized protein YukE